MPNDKPSNDEIANILDRIADLLEAQDANPHRVRAYRTGAESVRAWDERVADRVTGGDEGALQRIPNIGESLAGVMAEYVRTGRSNLLERLQGEVTPEKVFAKAPGIGPKLAERIADELDIDTLEQLEQAAHDGRLQEVAGFGPERVESVKVSLAGMLSRSAQRRMQRGGEAAAERAQPSIKTLLAVDAEYRRKTEAGELKRIAPRRFNPDNEAWLPIMHTERDGWNFTVLYSNTARAHDLGTTHDWVVLYYERDGREDQATVVTKKSGPLEGKRVVRGREAECQRYYERAGSEA